MAPVIQILTIWQKCVHLFCNIFHKRWQCAQRCEIHNGCNMSITLRVNGELKGHFGQIQYRVQLCHQWSLHHYNSINTRYRIIMGGLVWGQCYQDVSQLPGLTTLEQRVVFVISKLILRSLWGIHTIAILSSSSHSTLLLLSFTPWTKGSYFVILSRKSDGVVKNLDSGARLSILASPLT